MSISIFVWKLHNCQKPAYSKEMAGPIVFLNSQMASYASGVLMEVDYGNTIEERASIKPIQQVISLEAIHQMMQQQSNK